MYRFHGLIPIPPQFAPQGIEMDIDCTRIVLKARTPYMVKDFLTGADTIDTGGKEVQQTIFQPRQMDILSVPSHAPLLAVYLNMFRDMAIHKPRKPNPFLKSAAKVQQISETDKKNKHKNNLRRIFPNQ